jgi:predicted transcriptional regulator
MCRKKTLDLLGPTERAIMQLLWEMGPQTTRQIWSHFQTLRSDVAYTTILTPLQELHGKGMLTRTRDKQRHVYQAVPKTVLLQTAFERMLVEVGATESDRTQIMEVLRG